MEIKTIIYDGKDYLVSYSPNRTPIWLVTQGFESITGKLKKKVVNVFKKEEKDMLISDFDLEDSCGWSLPIACPSTSSCASSCTKPAYPRSTKKDNNMSTANLYVTTPAAVDPNASKVDYLTSRLYETFCKKDWDLETAFGLKDDEPPKSLKEFVQRIKDGKFAYPKGYLENGYNDQDDYFDAGEAGYRIRWRDPAVKEDRDGYKAAMLLMQKSKQDALDLIKVSADPADGLKALQEFESKTFH